MEKIKPELNGVAETMLQTIYARAWYSKQKKHLYYDEKAVEIVERMDYDFSLAGKDKAMSSGTIARTFVFDELVSAFIKENPEAVVVNIACGLDTRFYRLDNGRITWYNLDLPETIQVRRQYFDENGRVSMIGVSALDSAWASRVTKRGKMLFIIEGLTMYLSASDVKTMLGIIRDNFDNAYVLMETISPMWVKNESVEKSIATTGAKFLWGANSFEELGDIAEGFEKVRDDNILRGMEKISPVNRLVDWLPIAKKITQKILIFEKSQENGSGFPGRR